jgi:catechol 2,3-dioxygenase-like lactoylglutathione lyase family enzyme
VSGAENWDWSLRVFDHVDLRADDYAESVRFYETVLAPLGIPKISQRPEGTCFTNLNVVDRRPATQNLHLCFHAREKGQVDGRPRRRRARRESVNGAGLGCRRGSAEVMRYAEVRKCVVPEWGGRGFRD